MKTRSSESKLPYRDELRLGGILAVWAGTAAFLIRTGQSLVDAPGQENVVIALVSLLTTALAGALPYALGTPWGWHALQRRLDSAELVAPRDLPPGGAGWRARVAIVAGMCIGGFLLAVAYRRSGAPPGALTSIIAAMVLGGTSWLRLASLVHSYEERNHVTYYWLFVDSPVYLVVPRIVAVR